MIFKEEFVLILAGLNSGLMNTLTNPTLYKENRGLHICVFFFSKT